MRFVSLSSGSRGNCIFVSTVRTKILVDCGISAKRADEALKSIGSSLREIDALLITHEHSDHIKGAKRLMNTYGIPLYATGGTLRVLPSAAKDEYFSFAGRRLMEEVYPDREFEIGDISITPFRTYHDVAEPCAYRMEIWQDKDKMLPYYAEKEPRRHVSLAVMTDCGHYDDYISDHLRLLDTLLLEANHDREMLMKGPYPQFLKQRISSGYGHLSNDMSGRLLAGIISPRMRSVLLGHLSDDNNTHELALSTVKGSLREAYGSSMAETLDISIAPQGVISKIIEL